MKGSIARVVFASTCGGTVDCSSIARGSWSTLAVENWAGAFCLCVFVFVAVACSVAQAVRPRARISMRSLAPTHPIRL
jgi:hypothetical protein